MKAIAKQIGKSQKEQVIVDGAVFLKSVAIGKWSHIINLTVTGLDGVEVEYIGKSGSRANAEKWLPFEMYQQSYLVPGVKYSPEQKQRHKDFIEKHKEAGRWVNARTHGFRYKAFRVELKTSREIFEIERAA